ncbi:MAG: hypothetical protein KC422_01215 [Trueperaceae bacterium]|nr:hypothetical protein [Trueperaceae bacterium]
MSKVLAFLFLAITLISCVPSVYQPYPIDAISLPRDEAAHRAPIEWWYWTGHLQDEAGHDYGFELTFFKAYAPENARLFGFIPAWWLVEKGHIGHFAITDLGNKDFHMAQISDFGNFEASTSEENLDLRLHTWSAQKIGEREYQIKAELGDKKLELFLTAEKPMALHGNPPGIQSMGPGGVSYYLSYTRMAAEGVLKTNCTLFSCEEHKVTGQAWHDHQWGDFTLDAYAGWDWFSLQLDDNTEVMLYFIRQPDGSYSTAAGSFIDQVGQVKNLSSDDFSLTPTGKLWKSETTGAVYPLEWTLSIPGRGLELLISPLLEKQEMNTRATTGIVYWEGAVGISGSHTGKGYVELTNYDLYPYGEPQSELKPLSGPLGN